MEPDAPSRLIMPFGCLSVILCLLVSFNAQLSCIPAFRIPHQPSGVRRNELKQGNIHKTVFPAPPLTKCNRLNTQLTLLLSENNGLNEKDLSLQAYEGAKSRKPALLRRKGRRRWRYEFSQQETHVTAAGAESLFTLSWWPFSFETKHSAASAIHNNVQYVDSLDLPPIDCGWACVSNSEQIQLQQMKLLLRSELKTITLSNLNEKYPDVYSDLRLLRFLRKSKERDVNAAAERYRTFLDWRAKNEVDNIRAMIENFSDSFTPMDERLQIVATYFPMNFEYLIQTTDESNEGGKSLVKPAILNVGEFNTRGITDEILASESDVALEDFLNYWIFLYESIHVRLYQQTIQFGQMTFLDEVCDLSGLSLQQFSPSFVTTVMSPWLKMTQAYYPETTRRIYILHPPAIVKVAWKLVTPLLSQGTIDKISFVRKFDGSASEFIESGSWID